MMMMVVVVIMMVMTMVMHDGDGDDDDEPPLSSCTRNVHTINIYGYKSLPFGTISPTGYFLHQS
jgi:hypothetical protein